LRRGSRGPAILEGMNTADAKPQPVSPHGEHGLGPALDRRWRETAPPSWVERWSLRDFDVEGGVLEGLEMGSGPPLVLLPPLPGWKESYLALAPLLARRFRVIAFDLRDVPGTVAGWDQLVADAHRIAGALAPGPVAVFGHSLGAALAMRWALRHPEQVRALVLSSGFAHVFTPPGAGAARYLSQPIEVAGMRWLPEGWSRAWTRRLAARNAWVFDPYCEESVVELMRLGARTVPLSLLGRRVQLALAHDVRGELHQIHCPTLILAGERDTAFARASAVEIAAALPNAERAEIAGAGHLHPASRPEALGECVSAWLDRTG
jgi:pimeloyl-ACP methyl ester carboxylesterase